MILKNSISHSFGFTTLQPYFPTSFSSCFWIPHDHFPKCVQIFPDFCWISIGFPITLGLGKLRRMLQQLKPETVVSLVEAPMFLLIKRGMVDAFPWDLWGFSIGFSGFGDENWWDFRDLHEIYMDLLGYTGIKMRFLGVYWIPHLAAGDFWQGFYGIWWDLGKTMEHLHMEWLLSDSWCAFVWKLCSINIYWWIIIWPKKTCQFWVYAKFFTHSHVDISFLDLFLKVRLMCFLGFVQAWGGSPSFSSVFFIALLATYWMGWSSKKRNHILGWQDIITEFPR